MEDAAAYPLLELPQAAQELASQELAARENGRFTAAIIAALALHLAAVAISLYTPMTTRMGEETGSQEGLTVEIVDENDLSSPTGQPPAAPAAPPAPPQPAAQNPSEPVAAEQPPPAEPTPDLKSTTHEEALKPATEAPAAPPEAAKPPPAPATSLEELDPNLFKIQPQSPPKTASNKAESIPAQQPATQPKPQPLAKQPKPANPEKPDKPANPEKPDKPAKPEKPAQLSMTVPTPSFTSSNEVAGRSAGISRPAGITRSGLNDEFGRGVIRALRQTMPPNSRAARATVRFVLTKDGNLAEVELVQSSGDATLDQNVVFAVKQANFPIPATNLTALDRQFRVTYVYR